MAATEEEEEEEDDESIARRLPPLRTSSRRRHTPLPRSAGTSSPAPTHRQQEQVSTVGQSGAVLGALGRWSTARGDLGGPCGFARKDEQKG